MSEWKEYRLGELASVIPGFAFKGKDFGVNGCRVVKIGDITPPIVDVTNCLRIPTEKINGLDKFKLQKGDFVLAMTGATLGKVGKYRSEETGYINQRVAKFENIKGISDKHFLYYLITSNHVTNEIINRGLGSAQPNISGKDIETINVVAPDLPTQTAIAEILSSLDDKIELNNKINQELENLAQTLFKQWFIDFEFPNENGEPYKSSGGEMVDSELGEIPKGWSDSKLEDISNISIGRTPPRQEHHWFSENPNDVMWISIKDMGNCGTFILNTSEFLTEEAVSKFKIPIIASNTVIISFKLTVGRISITTERMLSNEAIAHINLIDDSMSPEFIYLYLKQFNFDSLGSTSSIATAVNSKAIKALKFIKPSQDVFQNFQLQVFPVFQQILSYTKENQQLTNLRDTLLPKLISGELEVSQIPTTS